MSKSFASIISLIVLTAAAAFGQGPPAPPALSFEVASIKPAEAITPASIAAGKLHLGMNVDGARIDIGYMSLADLIPIAFRVKPFQVSGPDWLNSQRFDILAKLPEGATKEQVPEMLQALLTERFGLKVHRETRELPVYALTVAKGGHKLKESPPDADPAPTAAEPPKGAITLGAGDRQISISNTGNGATVTSAAGGTMKMTMGQNGQMQMQMGKMTMPAFTELLTRLVDRPVVDMTELKGNYQVALDLAMTDLLSVARLQGINVPGLAAGLGGRGEPGRVPDASDPSGGSIFASVQQLGLRLDPRKAPTDVVVIDHVEKSPTEN